MNLTDGELALFAELLDEVPGEDPRLLRDRIETYLYLKGYYDVPDTFYDEVRNEWRATDGLYDGYGSSPMEAIHELRRNMGK